MKRKVKRKIERRLNAANLKANGITIDESLEHDIASITHNLLRKAPQASMVAEGLLDFNRILSPSSFKRLNLKTQDEINKRLREAKIPPPRQRHENCEEEMDAYRERYGIAEHDTRLNFAQRISMRARNVKSGAEQRWSEIVKTGLFGDLIKSARAAEGLKVFDPKQAIERIRVEAEDQWGRGWTALRQTMPKEAGYLTAPKPDLYVALPVYEPDSDRTGFLRDDYIQNFQRKTLADLEEKTPRGLISSPLTRLNTVKDMDEKHLVCFPFVCIEIKPHEVKPSEIQRCYQQAANAASTALAMLSALSDYSLPYESFGEIRPVVAFTFIGPESRVWIAYISKKTPLGKKMLCKYNMKCIWKGSLLKDWDVIQLHRIIENCHYWAVRHFRPWVSSCLDRWRYFVESDDEEDETSMDEWEENSGDSFDEDNLNPTDEDDDESENEDQGSGNDEDDSDEDNLNPTDEDDNESENEDQGSGNDADDSDEDRESTPERQARSRNYSSYRKSRHPERNFESSPIPRIKLPIRKSRRDESANDEPMNNESSRGFGSPAPRRRNATTLSPDVPRTRRTPLHHGETSPLTVFSRTNTRHNRSRSTGYLG